MGSDLLQIYNTIFNKCWLFFSSFKIPGTNFTPAIMFLFVSILGLGIRFVRSFAGLSWDRNEVNLTKERYIKVYGKND